MAKDAEAVGVPESAVQKAEVVISTMLAKGFILGKDALNKAKALDEKHQFTSAASAKVSSLDKEDRAEQSKSAWALLLSMKRSGKWMRSFRSLRRQSQLLQLLGRRVARAASDVGSKAAKEKVVAEQEHKSFENDIAKVHLPETPSAATGEHSNKPAPAQGLVL
ncbi:putative binding partner of ACD11 1 [Cocos nucifera]|uniref:Putative binding partner of ACD11 1 n=1 Tax=Cocos nucifera TaxID=13894 RepID=A0A8K0IEB5_COCNU|nr:putative binding partner of ACD11 1 [Cocos nucifera]